MKILRRPKDGRLDWVNEKLDELGKHVRKAQKGTAMGKKKDKRETRDEPEGVHHDVADVVQGHNTYEQADAVLNGLLTGAISPTIAGKANGLLRTKQNHIQKALDHATRTGRLQEGSPVLPDFLFKPNKF